MIKHFAALSKGWGKYLFQNESQCDSVMLLSEPTQPVVCSVVDNMLPLFFESWPGQVPPSFFLSCRKVNCRVW